MSPLSNPFDADLLTRLSRVSSVALAPDESWLAVAVSRLSSDESTYESDLWRVSVHDPNAPAVRLTHGECVDNQPRFRADGRLGFLSNRSGPMAHKGEAGAPKSQVWLFGKDGGEPEPVTDEPLGVMDYRFAAGTGALFFIAPTCLGIPHDQQRARAADLQKRGPSGRHYTAFPVRHWDHWVPEAAPHVIVRDPGGERRDLTPEADREHRTLGFDMEWDVSPDGRRVVITVARIGPGRIMNTGLRVIDVATGDWFDLGVVDDTEHLRPRFSPDGKAIACARMTIVRGRVPQVGLWLFDDLSAGAAGRAVAPEWDARPQVECWTPDRRGLMVTADTFGRVPVFHVDIDSGEVSRVTSEGAGGSHFDVHLGAARSIMVGVRHGMLQPPEPFCMALDGSSEPVILANLTGFTPEQGEAIAAWESFVVRADDGASVQSFVVVPRSRPGPHPVLVWIHGGPVSQHVDGWHWRWNPLVAVAAGYAVVLPNPRGSSGCDGAFVDGVWNNQWGGACYRDVMAVTEAVAGREDMDGERMGAMGGSFGGYMANWIGVSTERFRCILSHAGIFAMTAFGGTTDYPEYFYYEMGCVPFEAPEEFDRYSPQRRVTRWKTPTLITHGERDYRVPIGEALQLFDALVWHGVDAELLVFPDEGHWIQRPQNIRQWYRVMLKFAGKHLMGL